jgi:hypothetical protein
MSKAQSIRGTKVDGDVVDLATDDSGLTTAIVSFFEGAFPRSRDQAEERMGKRARSRLAQRSGAPQPILPK